MKKTKVYHICLASHEEVMFRSTEDLNMGFNCLAVAAIGTESSLLAEGFLTTHYHGLLRTSSLEAATRAGRNAYSRFFNTKYHRRGRLAERKFFYIEIDGLHHTMAALNYVIRQGLHHGLAATPFGWPHCSANSFFRKDLGKFSVPELLPDCHRQRYLPSNVKIPSGYRMTSEGLLLREDVLDVPFVEQLYTSPRNYIFQMNKITEDSDIARQQGENTTPPVTLESIESGVPGFTQKDYKANEYGKVNRSLMTDLELCSYIDNVIVPRYIMDSQAASVYLIPEHKRAEICESLWDESQQARWRSDLKSIFSRKYITRAQLCRCFCVSPS